MINCVWFDSGSDCPDGKEIRIKVFVDEQKYPMSEEFDEYDSACPHLVIYVDGVPAATARIFMMDDAATAKLGRLAVKKEYRGRHLGAELIKELKKKAAEMGAESLYVSAQTYAVPFYAKYGFVPRGNEYLDIHIPHIDMFGSL